MGVNRWPGVVLATWLFAAGARLWPLTWSPFPATLDGFTYARQAEQLLGPAPLVEAVIAADEVGATTLLAMTARVTGLQPLRLAQPLFGLAGASIVLVAAALALRTGRAAGWGPRQRWRLAGLAGVLVAVDGLVVRRTGVPDEDALTLVVIPLAVYALARVVTTDRAAWLGVGGLLLAVLPVTHNFSALVAGLTVTAFAAAAALQYGLRRSVGVLLGLTAGYWLGFVGYYRVMRSLGLGVPYTGRILEHPGLFLAWVIVLVCGALWFRGAARYGQRALLLGPAGLAIGLVVVNASATVFPGTAATPLLVVALVLPLVVPVALGAWGVPLVTRSGPVGLALFALFWAPLVIVGFGLTAALTPDFLGTVLRGQTHAHLPVLILAAAATLRAAPRTLPDGPDVLTRRRLRVGLAAVLVVAVVATLPLAYLHLDTGTYPATTTEAEFAAAGFASTTLDATWTTDQPLTQVAGYHGGARARLGPTASWLTSGVAPGCPALTRQSWTTTGAHLFPSAPETITPRRYARWQAERHVVYATTGSDPLTLVVPVGDASDGC